MNMPFISSSEAEYAYFMATHDVCIFALIDEINGIFIQKISFRKFEYPIFIMLTYGKLKLDIIFTKWQSKKYPLHEGISVGRCVIPWEFLGKSVKHIFSCREMYSV